MSVLLLLPLGGRADILPANNSFETPNLGSGVGAYQYNPSIAAQGGAGWTFLDFSGIAANGSGFGVVNTPDGNQAGFVQRGGNFSQSVGGFTNQTYTVNFYAEGRQGYGFDPLTVTLDGTPLTFGGSSTVNQAAGPTFVPYTSDPVKLTAGSHTLAFLGQNPGNDLTTFLDLVSFHAVLPPPPPPHHPSIANASFEAPNLAGGYQYNPSLAAQGGAGWTFLDFSGIAANGSGFGVVNTPDGNQAGFVQRGGNFSQSVQGFGAYTLKFSAEGRQGYGSDPFTVTVDGTPLTFGGSTTVDPPAGTTFVEYESDLFHMTPGAHTIAFIGQNPGGDLTSFIDAVTFAAPDAAPEPSTFVLASAGILGLFAYGYRRQRLQRHAGKDPLRAGPAVSGPSLTRV